MGEQATPFPSFIAAPDLEERIRLEGLGIEHLIRVPSAATGGQLVMVEEITAPGMGPPRHIHHRQTEIFRFMEGDFEVLIDDTVIPAPPGTCVVVPPGRVHAFRNKGSTPGRFIFLLTPANDAEGFFRALAKALREGPPDPAKLNALGEPWGFEVVGPPLG